MGVQCKCICYIVALPYVCFRHDVNRISKDIVFMIKFGAMLEEQAVLSYADDR
jgi:hypothetical protein